MRTLVCHWFVDNKLSIHFGEDKTESTVFSSNSKIEKASPLKFQYKGKKVKQYINATYLGCIVVETVAFLSKRRIYGYSRYK